ncbi:hypothetical protein BXY70_2890 [Roseovarius halotolerans]|uniref:Uncharacterized protein n=1 Tax=Roseovarius halotolerans TaxID=505353 RepID=A0A1X6ZGL3_9RHOB|nr:hypothetical protein [Roseovarius halotolerans]RKT30894.1 hypothetical protein BXY70_2890 [Roseovarius halotolerans]SLN51101.1 hypothetical protein ROH8110_02786 [Roseovarius halotolerans]
MIETLSSRARMAPPSPTSRLNERDSWRVDMRRDLLAAAFQGGVTSDFWLEALLDRMEARP